MVKPNLLILTGVLSSVFPPQRPWDFFLIDRRKKNTWNQCWPFP